MTVKLKRIEQADGAVTFAVTVPAERAHAWETMLSAAICLTEPPKRAALLVPASVRRGEVGAAAGDGPREPPGKLLRRLRTECRMTQREAAKIAGTSQPRISDFECGVRVMPPEIADIFARRFGVRPEDFGG